MQEQPIPTSRAADGQAATDGAYPFTAAQLKRLAIYRAAVQARFYSDEAAVRHDGPARVEGHQPTRHEFRRLGRQVA